MSNREVVEAYARAFGASDLEDQYQYLHPDLVEVYPQSGEVFRGRDARQAMFKSWPQDEFPTAASMPSVIGSADQWILMPTFSTLKVMGTGDEYTGVGTVTYPNGETWHMVQLIRLREGKIAHLTSYFAAPFPAPDWRAPFREEPAGQ